jgi:hypothetical protein
MRSLIVLVFGLILTGCSCGGQGTMTLRNPILFDTEPATAAGARYVALPPQYAAPALAAPAGCAPSGLPLGYQAR